MNEEKLFQGLWNFARLLCVTTLIFIATTMLIDCRSVLMETQQTPWVDVALAFLFYLGAVGSISRRD